MSVPVFISVGGMKREHFVRVVEEALDSLPARNGDARSPLKLRKRGEK